MRGSGRDGELQAVDCYSALITLPIIGLLRNMNSPLANDEARQYSTNAVSGSLFKLPRHFVFGTCLITVDLGGPGDVRGDVDLESHCVGIRRYHSKLCEPSASKAERGKYTDGRR